MRTLKFDIILWDGSNKETITHYSIEEAVQEDFIQFEGDTVIPTDESVIIRQCTGMTDKYGIGVFEDDVVRLKYIRSGEVVGVVKWSKGGYYVIKTNDKEYNNKVIPYPAELEIIGNIYENPEPK